MNGSAAQKMSEQQNTPTIKETLNLVIEHHQAKRRADAENIRNEIATAPTKKINFTGKQNG